MYDDFIFPTSTLSLSSSPSHTYCITYNTTYGVQPQTNLQILSNKMAPPTNRDEILARLRRQISDGKPIVGAGAGTIPLLNLIQSFIYILTIQESAYPPNPSKPAAAT